MSAEKVVKLPVQPKRPEQEGFLTHALNLPNILTFLRILMVPIYVILFLEPTVFRSILAAGVFGMAALTDLLDGHLARQRGQVTKVGRLLDPVADKFLVISGKSSGKFPVITNCRWLGGRRRGQVVTAIPLIPIEF